MPETAADRFIALAKTQDNYAQTVAYIASHTRRLLRPRERVLLCYWDRSPYSMGEMLRKALSAIDADPVFWEPDGRWQTLLKQAFTSHATAVIGPPLVVLALTKLAKATQTPLSIRNVLLAGAPSEDWIVEGIRTGLDAAVWGCYDPIPGLVVGGFSCQEGIGVHIREDALQVHILSSSGVPLPDGQLGQIYLSPRSDDSVLFDTGEQGRILPGVCGCGCKQPRLGDFRPGFQVHPTVQLLRRQLLSWYSVLDFRAEQTDMGLSLEIITFPGVRLPQLPSGARITARSWDPQTDRPFE